MKKKLILIVTIITILSMLVCCLAACDDKDKTSTNTEVTNNKNESNNNENSNNNVKKDLFTSNMTLQDILTVVNAQTDNKGATIIEYFTVDNELGVVTYGYSTQSNTYFNNTRCYNATGTLTYSYDCYAIYDFDNCKVYMIENDDGDINYSYSTLSQQDIAYAQSNDGLQNCGVNAITELFGNEKNYCTGRGIAENLSTLTIGGDYIQKSNSIGDYKKVYNINSTIVTLPDQYSNYKTLATPS